MVMIKRFPLGFAIPLLVIATTRASSDVSEKTACELGEPRCVDLVIKEMNKRFRKLAKHCDHDAIFSVLYLRTTEKFRDTLDTIGYADPSSVIREDGLFAEFYFRAFDAFHAGKADVPPAWNIAFTAAQDRAVSSPGNALLGFNAHIQRDLPFVLYELHLRGTPVSHEDHTLVNTFLAQVDATAEIVQRFDPTFDDNADPVALFQLIVSWREQAFTNFVRLRDAASPEARAAVEADIEASAAAVALGIARSTAYPPGTDSSARDAFCAQARDHDD
jgi:hypothetical protein